jgi:hypothetical protein
MKKNNGMLVLLGMVIILVSIAAMLLPLGTGFVTAQGDNITGYDFVFGNSSARINPEQGGPYGGLITAFVLGCVGGLFQIIALIFSFGQGGKKFVGFMDIVAGLCFVTTAILFFLAKSLVGSYLNGNAQIGLTLSWGFLGAAIASAVSGVLSLGVGFKTFLAKE